MKSTFLMILGAVAFWSCSYHQIATLTVASSRNFDRGENYILLGREVKGKGKEKKNDAMVRAIDDAVLKHPTGEFMKNVRVYVSRNGKTVKVEGDVWGRDTTRTR